MAGHPRMVHFGIGENTYHALRVAVATSKEPSLKSLLYRCSISEAVSKYASEYAEEVRKEMRGDK